MAYRIWRIWYRWKQDRQQKILLRYLGKRSAILKQGLHLYADVQDCYSTCLSAAQGTLVRLRLSIPIKGKTSIQAVSTAFIMGDSKSILYKRLRIRFLPGDLSHVVITG